MDESGAFKEFRIDAQGPYLATTLPMNSASTEYMIQSAERETPWPSLNTVMPGTPVCGAVRPKNKIKIKKTPRTVKITFYILIPFLFVADVNPGCSGGRRNRRRRRGS